MKRVRAFNKNLYIGREWECERLIRRLEKSGIMERLKCQRYTGSDTAIYGVYVDYSGYYLPNKPAIIVLESKEVAEILTDWYGKEV